MSDLSACHLEVWVNDPDRRTRLQLVDTRPEGFGTIASCPTSEPDAWQQLVQWARERGGDNPDWREQERASE